MAVYYNENDKDAAAWLRELIRMGELPDGDVDDRSVLEVEPADLRPFAHCHFFAGIGGWALALDLIGWPRDVPTFTGSCPCQPLSSAGQQRARADERHLWPVWHRLIAARRPRFIFGEQVASALAIGKVGRPARGEPGADPQWAWLDDVWADLEDARYAVGSVAAPACGVGAPHIRLRTWFGAVGLVDGLGEGLEGHAGDGDGGGRSLPPGSASPAGDAGRLADGPGQRCPGVEVVDGAAHGRAGAPAEIAGGGGPGGLADPADARREGRGRDAGPPPRRESAGADCVGGLGDADGLPGERHAGGLPGSQAAVDGARVGVDGHHRVGPTDAGDRVGRLADPGEGERRRLADAGGRDDDGAAARRVEGDGGAAHGGERGRLADARAGGRESGPRHVGLCSADVSAEGVAVVGGADRAHGRLADAHGGDAAAERELGGREHGFVAQGDGAGGLADAPARGRTFGDAGRGAAGVGQATQGRRVEAGGGDAPGELGGPAGRWADPLDGGWSDCDWLWCRDGRWRPVESRPEPLADGLPAGMGPGGDLFAPLIPRGHPDAEARVIRLRGYGNAIVPQEGAAFVLSFLDALEGLA